MALEQPEDPMSFPFKIGELVKLKQDPKFDMSETGSTEPSLDPYFKTGVAYRIRAIAEQFRWSLARVPYLSLEGLPNFPQHPGFFESIAVDCVKESPALQIAALTTVYEKLQDPEMCNLKRKLEDTTLEMERARMEREDLRAASFSPYGTNYTPGVRVRDDPNWRYQTWREFGQERDDMCNHLVYEVMEPAQDTLLQARRNIRMAWQDPNTDYPTALKRAYNAMCDAERQLRDSDSDQSESNTDED